jgi:tRNA dimethylallyltransferase
MIIVIAGATGTGKSLFAIELAKLINGEIVDADAFQVYEGLTIATAAPTSEMLSAVPHHLYGFVPLNEGYDIARYQHDARREIADILARGKTPILVGGAGLYLRSALYDYDFSVSTDGIDLTAYEKLSDEELHRKLTEFDDAEAIKIHPHNRVRALRAIAICLASGKNKSLLIGQQKHQPIYDVRFYGLQKERDSLYSFVEERVDGMFAAGLLEETLPLVEKYGRGAPAFKAIGVKELFPYIDGSATLIETSNLIKINTRHYIKRQETFFRHQFDLAYVTTPRQIADAVK